MSGLIQSAAIPGKPTALRWLGVNGIAQELSRNRTIVDPAREKLLKTRESLVSAWMKAADVLDAQGEIILAGDVPLPCEASIRLSSPIRQKLAAQVSRDLVKKQRESQRDVPGRVPKDYELAR